MGFYLSIALYIAVTVILIVFFRKAMELFFLLSNKLYEKYKKNKKSDE